MPQAQRGDVTRWPERHETTDSWRLMSTDMVAWGRKRRYMKPLIIAGKRSSGQARGTVWQKLEIALSSPTDSSTVCNCGF
jgi:hypothetical protein